MTANPKTTRRTFLSAIAATAAGAATTRVSLIARAGQPQTPDRAAGSPHDRIQIALIGAGNMGVEDTKTALTIPGVALVGVCDLYDGRLAAARTMWGEPLRTTRD